MNVDGNQPGAYLSMQAHDGSRGQPSGEGHLTLTAGSATVLAPPATAIALGFSVTATGVVSNGNQAPVLQFLDKLLTMSSAELAQHANPGGHAGGR